MTGSDVEPLVQQVAPYDIKTYTRKLVNQNEYSN